MTNEPLMDRSQIEQIMKSAKARRVEYLQKKVEPAAGVAKWGGVAALAAYCIAFFTTHGGSTAS
jgi:hypothetical protein